MLIPENYFEKVYAGFLGKCIGIRLGAPVEPALWNMDRIEKVYGFIDRYVKPYKTFAADDDSNGPAYFIRALIDDARDGEPGSIMPVKVLECFGGEGMESVLNILHI